MPQTLIRRLVAEALGTGFLLMSIVGSGIMAEPLAGGNSAIALLANTVATGAALLALILTFGPISGAHFNPIVSLSFALQKNQSWYEFSLYVVTQTAAAIAGVIVANLMFGISLISFSRHDRSGIAQLLSEYVASFGLVGVIVTGVRSRSSQLPFAVAAFITAAYWFTPSTSFANPAVTIARALSDTFAGIAPTNVIGFVLAQIAGGVSATFLCSWLVPPARS